MKTFFSKRGKLWMFVMLAMLIALASAGTSTSFAYASSNLVEVPFNGSFSGTIAMTGETTAVLNGSGIAVQLGNAKYAGNVSDITPTSKGFSDILVETLTAANGDTLIINCVQVALQTSPGVFVGTDQWTVVGGTGLFAGATGSGTGVTQIDLNNGKFDKRLTGNISAPNGNLS